ncbi:MAG TPA: STAS domain-containing protein [Tepidisphaeraceae bacterium]|jgi:anti-anti-sigma factor|nr:STAS domain-containing protein [Tepidisphaeraceae bacterium]
METLTTGTKLIPAGRKDEDALILSVRGELDLHNSPELRTHLFDLLNRNQPKRLILNLAEVPYMDSSALAVLVEALKRILKSGGRVFLVNLQPRVKGLLEIARLATIFVICKDEQEAIAK